MKKKAKLIVVCVFLLSVFLTSCGPGQFLGPTVTPTNTVTPTQTNTPMPTNTPSPTNTPTPLPTLTPTIEPASQFSLLFENPQITAIDTFDYYDKVKWGELQLCTTVNNGELHYACGSNGFLGLLNRTFHEGEGISIDFKLDKQITGYYSLSMSVGNWGKDDWKRFGISDEPKWGPQIGFSHGAAGTASNIAIPQWIKPDVWYRYVSAVDQNGKVIIAVWERDKADAVPHKYINTMGESWAGLDWAFWMNSAQDVSVYLDNFSEIAFSKIK
jgi:hypothetical protein